MGRQQTMILLLVWLATLSKLAATQTDAEMLQAEDWATAFGWNESLNMRSNWTGVTCGANDRVTAL